MSPIQLGQVPPEQLNDARLDLHHAVQLVAITVGSALLPKRDDDSHTALTWLDVPGQWVGEEIPETGGIRAGLRPADLTLTLGGKDDPAGDQLPLAGVTRETAVDWLRERLARHGVDRSRVAHDPHYEIPHHPVDDGNPWSLDHVDGHAELARWYAASSVLLGELTLKRSASPILTWPHHFDIATLIDLGNDKTLGVGMTPGDDDYAQPYWYLSPLPRPKKPELPDLPLGHWHTDGYLAAVATGEEVLGASSTSGDASGDKDGVAASREFLKAAFEAGKRVLGD